MDEPCPEPSCAPRDLGAQRVGKVLYLFSGPAQAEGGIPALCARVKLGCVALDTVIDPTENGEHDLLVEARWVDLERRLRAGEFSLVIASPPCSTFSRARGKGVGPRRLRSAALPYGFPKAWLKLKEHKQLREGNYLAVRTARFLELTRQLGVPFVFENPQPFEGESSMFLLREYADLANSPGVEVADFDQCCFGAESVKPTRFLLHKCRGDRFRCRCNHKRRKWTTVNPWGQRVSSFLPHPPLKGRKRGRQWATRALSAYPPDLNRAVLLAGVMAMGKRAAEAATDEPPSKRRREGSLAEPPVDQPAQ